MSPPDPLRNKNDPLHGSAPDRQLELFKAFSQLAHGYSIEDILGAALNVHINAIRQSCPLRKQALEAIDRWAENGKRLLDHHYTPGDNGKRRNLFPFTQTIEVPHFDLRNKKVGQP